MNRKAFTLIEIMIVVVIIGLLAVMAIPAFNKVRQDARAKTILNNLRQVASAGQQYILDKGTTHATYNKLKNDQRFPDIKPVAGEVYTALDVAQGGLKIVATAVGNQRVVYTYE